MQFTTNIFKTTRPSLMKDWLRFIKLEEVTYLLLVDFKISRSCKIEQKHFLSHHLCSQVVMAFQKYLLVTMVHNIFYRKWKIFTTSYGFQHINSSLYFPQSNGQAECTVKTYLRPLYGSPKLEQHLSYGVDVVWLSSWWEDNLHKATPN